MPDTILSTNREGTLSLGAQEIDLQELSELELFQRCVGSEGEAWLVFLSRIRPFLASVVINAIRHWSLPNSSLVDDLVQNTYVKLCARNFRVLRRLHFPHAGALFGFLKVVASNVAQDHCRSSRCQKRGNGKAEDDLEKVMPTRAQVRFDRDLEKRILIRQIEDCLQSQRREARFARDYKIFWLYYCQGLTAKEIAQQPNIGLGTKGVESTLLRLTRLVRLRLNKQPSRPFISERVN